MIMWFATLASAPPFHLQRAPGRHHTRLPESACALALSVAAYAVRYREGRKDSEGDLVLW